MFFPVWCFRTDSIMLQGLLHGGSHVHQLISRGLRGGCVFRSRDDLNSKDHF